MTRRDSGITLVEILAVVTVAAILLAILIPVHAKASRYKTVMECQDHLHTMDQARAKAPPSKVQEIGRAFWVRLTQATPPLVSPDVLKCPFVDPATGPFCQYLGPSGEIEKLDAKDPIGCDMELNHSEDRKQGGNLLLKNGQVVNDFQSLWATTVQTGKCRP
jgi:hypothetical protein